MIRSLPDEDQVVAESNRFDVQIEISWAVAATELFPIKPSTSDDKNVAIIWRGRSDRVKAVSLTPRGWKAVNLGRSLG